MNAVYPDQPMTARRARMIAQRGESLVRELERLGEGADLPEWVQAKIESAYQMIDSAFDYLEQMDEIGEISESDLFKARATKYTYRKRIGTNPKTGAATYKYYYNKPKTGRGIKSRAENIQAGASFVFHHKGQRGHFHVESVKGNKLQIVHDETGHSVEVTKKELYALLLHEHKSHLEEHAEHTAKRAVERGKKTKSGTHKGAERRARQAAELAQEAKGAGESVAAALGEKPKPKPKKKPAAKKKPAQETSERTLAEKAEEIQKKRDSFTEFLTAAESATDENRARALADVYKKLAPVGLTDKQVLSVGAQMAEHYETGQLKRQVRDFNAKVRKAELDAKKAGFDVPQTHEGLSFDHMSDAQFKGLPEVKDILKQGRPRGGLDVVQLAALIIARGGADLANRIDSMRTRLFAENGYNQVAINRMVEAIEAVRRNAQNQEPTPSADNFETVRELEKLASKKGTRELALALREYELDQLMEIAAYTYLHDKKVNKEIDAKISKLEDEQREASAEAAFLGDQEQLAKPEGNFKWREAEDRSREKHEELMQLLKTRDESFLKVFIEINAYLRKLPDFTQRRKAILERREEMAEAAAAQESTPSADNFETMPEGEASAAKLRQEYERPQFGRYNLSFKSLLEGGINMWGTVKLSKEDARAILAFYYDATLESLKTDGAFFEELGLSSNDNRTALVKFKERAEGTLTPQEVKTRKQHFTFTKNKLVRTPFMLESLQILRNEDLSNEEKLTALTDTFAKYDPSRDYTEEGLQFRIKRILKNLKDSIRDTQAYMDEQHKLARELGREDELPPLSFNEMGKAQFRDQPLAKYYLKEDFYSLVEMEENLNSLEDPLGFLKRLAEVARGPAEKKRARLLAAHYKTAPKKEPTPSADNFETMPEGEPTKEQDLAMLKEIGKELSRLQFDAQDGVHSSNYQSLDKEEDEVNNLAALLLKEIDPETKRAQRQELENIIARAKKKVEQAKAAPRPLPVEVEEEILEPLFKLKSPDVEKMKQHAQAFNRESNPSAHIDAYVEEIHKLATNVFATEMYDAIAAKVGTSKAMRIFNRLSNLEKTRPSIERFIQSQKPSVDNFETMPEGEAPSSPAAQAREELAEAAAQEPTPSADNFETMPDSQEEEIPVDDSNLQDFIETKPNNRLSRKDLRQRVTGARRFEIFDYHRDAEGNLDLNTEILYRGAFRKLPNGQYKLNALSGEDELLDDLVFIVINGNVYEGNKLKFKTEEARRYFEDVFPRPLDTATASPSPAREELAEAAATATAEAVESRQPRAEDMSDEELASAIKRQEAEVLDLGTEIDELKRQRQRYGAKSKKRKVAQAKLNELKTAQASRTGQAVELEGEGSKVPPEDDMKAMISKLQNMVKQNPSLAKSPEIMALLGGGSASLSSQAETDLVITLGGKTQNLPVKYKIVEAGDAIGSHHAGGFYKRPDYPEGVQEREYHNARGPEQNKVIVQAQNLNPQLLVNTNPDAMNGPPILTQDGIALGGNSRVMSVQRAYMAHPEKAKAYKTYLYKKAHTFGIDPQELDKFSAPLLVRELAVEDKSKESLAKLVRAMNEGLTQEFDATAEGRNAATKLLGENVTLKAIASALRDSPDSATLNSILKTPGSRLENIKRALFRDGIMTSRNSNKYIHEASGAFNDTGVSLVKKMITGYVLRDDELLRALSPSTEDNLNNALATLSAVGINREDANDIQNAVFIYNLILNKDTATGGINSNQSPEERDKRVKMYMEEDRAFDFGEGTSDKINIERLKDRVKKSPLSSAFLKILALNPTSRALNSTMKQFVKLVDVSDNMDMFAAAPIDFTAASKQIAQKLADQHKTSAELYKSRRRRGARSARTGLLLALM